LAPPKRGLWYAEPKLNGWRALIHTPTGTMWDRHGMLLTIADCFRPALGALTKLVGRGLVWADCEALERRHNLGRGTLAVLDMVPDSGTPSYEQKRAMLESLLRCEPVFDGDTSRPVPCGDVVLTPTMRADSHADALAFYQRLREANRAMRFDFFGGGDETGGVDLPGAVAVGDGGISRMGQTPVDVQFDRAKSPKRPLAIWSEAIAAASSATSRGER
jgi:hypothetical protein